MGQVGQKAAVVVVAIDSQEITAGSTLHGKAYVDVRKDIDDCSSIHISIIGNEVSNIDPIIKRANHEDQSYKFKSMVNIYSNSYPLCEIDGILSKGSYEFPFQCHIPSELPASMRCSSLSGDNCFIHYYVDVRIHRKGWLRWDLKDTVTFAVVSPPPIQPPSKALLSPVAVPVTSAHCIKRGAMLCGAIISANTLLRGSNFEVSHILINKSSAVVREIKISLWEHVRWTASRSHGNFVSICTFKRNLFSRTINTKCLATVDQQSLQPYKKVHGVVDEAGIYREIQNAIDNRVQHGGAGISVCAVISDDILATYNRGKFIKVWHELRIEVMTNFGTSNVIERKDVFVTRTAKQDPVNILGEIPSAGTMYTNGAVHSIPETWNPEVAQVTVIPDELGIQDVVLDLFSEDNDDARQSAVCNPDTMTIRREKIINSTHNIADMNFNDLITTMSTTYEKLNTLNLWFDAHGDTVQSLSPQEFAKLFEFFTFPEAQIKVASNLKLIRREITCQHISEVAKKCLNICRIEILSHLLSIRIVDIENKHVLRPVSDP